MQFECHSDSDRASGSTSSCLRLLETRGSYFPQISWVILYVFSLCKNRRQKNNVYHHVCGDKLEISAKLRNLGSCFWGMTVYRPVRPTLQSKYLLFRFRVARDAARHGLSRFACSIYTKTRFILLCIIILFACHVIAARSASPQGAGDSAKATSGHSAPGLVRFDL